MRSISLILLLISVIACSTPQEEVQQQTIQYVELVDWIDPDVVQALAAYQYEQDCIQWQLIPCNGSTFWSVYRQEAKMDMCQKDEFGNPLILERKECKKHKECQVTPELKVLYTEACPMPDGSPGEREVFCNKGDLDPGPCKPLCTEEICDYKDNDCDGEVDEEQLTACGDCEPVPEEVCDNYDNDCDGLTDEDIAKECETVCEKSVELCLDGKPVCLAQKPKDEVCNGEDDDCDGLVDEDLNCGCTPDLIGALIPCAAPPLYCGWGFVTCECADEDCKSLQFTPCQHVCAYVTPDDPNCDPTIGMPKPEICNNWDDDCDVPTEIDEDLERACYTGPPGTENIGICKGGTEVCEKGAWGSFDSNDIFQEFYCSGEVLPLIEDVCNGADDNCDGDIDDDKEMKPTDIVMIIDWSGSMNTEINAVMTAVEMFATFYLGEDTILWGVIRGPRYIGLSDTLELSQQPTLLPTFISKLQQISGDFLSGGNEMLYDAIYLTVRNLVVSPPIQDFEMSWNWDISSNPELSSFVVDWRPDAEKVVIVFSDEEGQSYLNPEVTQDILNTTISDAATNNKYHLYTFSSGVFKTYFGQGWQPPAQASGGKWYKLVDNPAELYSNLLEILDDTACAP